MIGRRRWLWLAIVLVATQLTSACYVTTQAVRQGLMFNRKESVDRVIKDPETDPKLRDKLLLTRDILAFAQEEGLDAKGAYDYLIDLKGRYVSYLVEAAHPDRLESVTWWFPFVGRVPYLGFFEQEDREEKATELRAQGFDVAKGGVGAFSSLGYFEDPIYRPMLDYRLAELAHLFFHELTHRTFWVRGSVKFNENLAEAIAFRVTRRYLHARGKIPELKQYDDIQEDKRVFRTWLGSLRTALERLYGTHPKSDPVGLLKAKKDLFATYVTGAEAPRFKVAAYVSGREEWNNATVLGAGLYQPDWERFEKAWVCSQTERAGDFLRVVKRSLRKDDDPFKALDTLCSPQ